MLYSGFKSVKICDRQKKKRLTREVNRQVRTLCYPLREFLLIRGTAAFSIFEGTKTKDSGATRLTQTTWFLVSFFARA